MSLLVGALRGLTLLFELPLLTAALYLLLLSVGALLRLRREAVVPSRAWAEFYDALPAFAILVEDRGSAWDVRTTLESIARLDYPADRRATIVVTEACGDVLWEMAHDAGAWVSEQRGTRDRAGTGALDAALNEIIVTDERFDAYVVVGSGAQLSTAFLRHMAAALAGGAKVAQARVCPTGSGTGWQVALDAIAASLSTYLRPLGRAYFGWSVGCQGDGVCFTDDVAQLFGWGGGAREDAQQSFRLAQSGIAITYVDGAMVFTDQPSAKRLSSAEWLREAHERLHVLVSRRGILRARRRGNPVLLRLDAALEVLLPPLPILAGLIALSIAAAWMLVWAPAQVMALLAATALAAHLVAGAVLADLSWREYRSLLQAPLALARLGLDRVLPIQVTLRATSKPHLDRNRSVDVPASALVSPGIARATGMDRLSEVPDSGANGGNHPAEMSAWRAKTDSVTTAAQTRSRRRGA